MSEPASDSVEELLASALELYDEGGEPAVESFLAAHPAQLTELRRGLQRCRELGLLGPTPAARDFPERLGEFLLIRRLGSGGMGVVYEAEQSSLGRRVALKVIRPELLYFEGARERFRREIEAVARLSHPAVVPVLASGEQDGVPWYAMELLAGRSLQEITQVLADADPARLEGSVLTKLIGAGDGNATDPFRGSWWETCVRAIHHVALGVRHAHLRGIVHRDIKPSNVMLTAHGQAVLLDFGIATITGSREFTRTGNTPGSPAFMSPEQLRGDAVDDRTDIYSLAATLWQLLALAPPFRGLDDLQKIRDGELPDLRAANREVPRELELVLRTAMDRDRERRYHDMESFAADLQAVLLRRPIRARRLGLPLRLLRWCQRHRVAATAAASLGLLAVILPAVLAWRTHSTNAVLAVAKAQADESFASTLDALDKVLLRLGSSQLRSVPGAEAVAIEALQDAVTMYRRLLPNRPDDVRLRQSAARALDGLAAAQERVGETETAIATWRESIAMLFEPRMELPPEWLDRRAHSHMNLASVFANHRRKPDALAEIDAAERDFAAVPDLPTWRATTLRGRGELCTARSVLIDYSDAAERPELERQLRLAIDFGRQQLELQPDDAMAMAALTHRMVSYAKHLVQDRRPAEAEPLLQDALALARRIGTGERIWPPPKMLLGDVMQTLGNLQFDQRDDRSLATLTECLQLREQCAAEFQNNVLMRTCLAGALHNLARAHVRRKDDEQALPLLQRALQIERAVLHDLPDYGMAKDFHCATLRLLNVRHANLGHREELVAGLAELTACDDSAATLSTAARQWLQALELAERDAPEDLPTLREQYARNALDSMLAAEQKGWNGGNGFELPLYAPLTRFPEFEGLKTRLAARRQRAEGK